MPIKSICFIIDSAKIQIFSVFTSKNQEIFCIKYFLISMTASEKIEKVLMYLDINAKVFSEKLGYERPQIIYDIQKGKTKKISEELASKIVSVFSDISKSWLLAGEGEMLRKGQNVADVSGSTIVGANVSGNGNSISHNDDSNIAGMIELQKGYQEMIKKSQEQLDRLLAVIENLTK